MVDEDKFTGRMALYTPLMLHFDSDFGFKFIKVINDDGSGITMRISKFEDALSVGKKGVYLLFDDGSKLLKNDVKIDVEVTGSKYSYQAFFLLTESDIKALSKKLITDVRLYIYDGTMDTDYAKEIWAYLRCLIN